MNLIENTPRYVLATTGGLSSLGPLVSLGFRIFIASIFWQAGINKFMIPD